MDQPNNSSPAGEFSPNEIPPSKVPGLILLAAILLVAYILMRPKIGNRHPSNHPAVGTKLSTLTLQPLTGDVEKLNLDALMGKVSMVNYWGTWCSPCRQEFPHMVALRDRFQSNDEFQLVSVSCDGTDSDDDPETLRQATLRFLKNMNVEFDTFADRRWESRKALIKDAGLREFAFPTTVLLDRAGVIRAIWFGYRDGYEVEMETVVSRLLHDE